MIVCVYVCYRLCSTPLAHTWQQFDGNVPLSELTVSSYIGTIVAQPQAPNSDLLKEQQPSDATSAAAAAAAAAARTPKTYAWHAQHERTSIQDTLTRLIGVLSDPPAELGSGLR
jgi:hypothetical protein